MKEGRLIEVINPQPEIRKNAELARDWDMQQKPPTYTGWRFCLRIDSWIRCF